MATRLEPGSLARASSRTRAKGVVFSGYGRGRSRTQLRMKLSWLSTRAVVSGDVCGQLGPLDSVKTNSGVAPVVKYGAPESYRQALVLFDGKYPTTSTVVEEYLRLGAR